MSQVLPITVFPSEEIEDITCNTLCFFNLLPSLDFDSNLLSFVLFFVAILSNFKNIQRSSGVFKIFMS